MDGAPGTQRGNVVVACIGGDETRLEERPRPVPGPGEMVLALRVVGLCGTDLFKLKTASAAPGSVLGHELVGTVTALGEGVRSFARGDRVVVPHHVPCDACRLCQSGAETMCATFKENLMLPGGFADQILIGARAVRQAARKVPDHLSDETAVFVEPAACVLRSIDRSGLGEEGVAVVLGAGSMGLLHLLVIRATRPAAEVVMVDGDSARLAIARRLGATATALPGKAARDCTMAASNELGADAVFDTVGGSGTLAAGIGLARLGGTVVLFAHAPEGALAGFDLNALFKSERRIVATYSGALKEQSAIFALMLSGALDPSPIVTHSMPLDDFATGVKLVTARKALKVLFTPSRAGAA